MSELVQRLRTKVGDGQWVDDDDLCFIEAADRIEALEAQLAAARRKALEEAAGIADQWGNGPSCSHHDDLPCCHVRTGKTISELIHKLLAETKEKG